MINILTKYRTKVTQNLNLVTSIHSKVKPSGSTWTQDDQIIITESAFLRVFMAWEEFLENSFIHYLLGKSSISGVIAPRLANPPDEAHAKRMITGVGRFADWSNADTVRNLSKNFFSLGVPFETPIASITQELNEIKTIRNASAHISANTQTQLDALANRLLRKPSSNVTVYDIIISIDPKFPKNTIFQSYINMLDAAATQISK